MSGIITTRFYRAAQTVGFARSMHASSVQLAGRKSNKVDFKRRAAQNRRIHAEIYEAQDDAFDMEDMEEWDYSDHHTYGHLLLESFRDVRMYLRKMEFEIPVLSEHAQKYVPPSSSQILHFERSAALGDKYSANERKVVLRVKVSKLNLQGPVLHKFLLLVGPRYNPETDELKMSEEREVTSLLNKKRLADTLNNLISESKKTDDSFGDIPLSFPHIKSRHKTKFPAEWMPRKL